MAGLLARARDGAMVARQTWRLCLVLFAIDLALAAGTALAVAVLVSRALASTTVAERIATGVDPVALVELWWRLSPSVGALWPLPLAALVLAAAVAAVALGAIWAAALGERGTAPLAAAAGRHAGAFVRIGLLAIPLYATAAGIVAAAARPLWRATEAGGPGAIAVRVATLFFGILLLLLVSTVVSYARAEKFLRPETHALRALGRGARFVFRERRAATLGLAGLGALAWVLAGLTGVTIAWWIPAGGWGAVLALLLVRQSAVLARVAIKVAWAGAEVRLYRERSLPDA